MNLSKEFWTEVFLFRGISSDAVSEMLNSVFVEIKEVKSGDVIYSPLHFEQKVGFIVSGECVVERIRSEGENLQLNKLSPFDSFGILTLFSCSDGFPTQIRAKKETVVAFISKKDMLALIEMSPAVALNIIGFMGERISFLNDKISTFSSDNVEQKFANFLILEAKKQQNLSFDLNRKKTAEVINVGRASLYRAIDLFVKKGLVVFEDKKINIVDLDGLERISK